MTTATETEQVYCNRQHLFRELGFSETQAALLALTQIHYYDCKKLLDAGCSHEVALKILQ